MTPQCIRNIKLFFLIIGVIITGSIEHITIPIMVTTLPSIYFLVLLIATEGLVLYVVILFIIMVHKGINTFKIELRPIMITICSGIVAGLMGICLLYSANPTRTPVVIQSIFLGTAIVPSIIFTKIILKKNIQYDLKYAVISLAFLFISVGFATIPLFQTENNFSLYGVGWIVMYLCGIILFSLYNILQEKYIMDTMDTSFENKIRLAFYAGLFQVITIMSLFWVDILLGYNTGLKEFANTFSKSIFILFENFTTLFLIQLFVFDCLALFVISIYLNEISTNYNMILTNLTNQSVALFFTIFPSFNHGIHYPIYVTALSMLCNILSVLFWIKCEPNEPIESDEIELSKLIKSTESDNLITNKINKIDIFVKPTEYEIRYLSNLINIK